MAAAPGCNSRSARRPITASTASPTAAPSAPTATATCTCSAWASGASFSGPTAVTLTAGDRPYYTAPAISPNGTDVYITYNAFTTPYRNDTSSARGLVGVIIHADVTAGTIGAFGTLARGLVGDPRASSQNNLQAEFLGDYVYTAATRAGAVGVWNDVRNGADCPAIDAWRLSLRTGTTIARPAPQQACLATFCNSHIFAPALSDPTPSPSLPRP